MVGLKGYREKPFQEYIIYLLPWFRMDDASVGFLKWTSSLIQMSESWRKEHIH